MEIIHIIGKGGFSREVTEYIKSDGIPRDLRYYEGEEINNIPNAANVIIAIGDPVIKERIYNELLEIEKKQNKYFFWESKDFAGQKGVENFRNGTIICPGVIFTTNIIIGRFCHFNLYTTIGHDCRIGSFVTTAPRVAISGNVTIGDRVYIGTGAIIKEKVHICSDVIIGAGAVVLKDITEPGTYVGMPAKKIK